MALVLSDVASLKSVTTTEGTNSLWGVSPVAPIHLGYDSLIVAQKEMLRLGLRHTILLADYHAILSHGLSLEDMSLRSSYYENYLRHCCGLSASFIRGSSFQTRPRYIERLYTSMSSVPVSRVKESLPNASKREGFEGTMASAYFYGIMQCLDCCFLNARVVFAEHSQSKVYKLLEYFPGKTLFDRDEFVQAHSKNIDHTPSLFIYLPTGCDIKGYPLSLSTAQTRITIHETHESLSRKIRNMFAAPSGMSLPHDRANALLEYFKNSVFPWLSHPLQVEDTKQYIRSYDSFESFLEDYQNGFLHPIQCKSAMLIALTERLMAIQLEMGSCLCDWVDTTKAIGL